MITAEQFLEYFEAEWQNTNLDLLVHISIWQHKKERTAFMLGKGGFLHQVMNRFLPIIPNLDYRTEIYTLDALYMSGEITYASRNYTYPAHIYAIIEHEHESNVEEEMWKLLLFRPTLKILIFYDFDEHRKTTVPRQNFIKDKILILQQMIKHAHSFLQESQDVVYLCLIGNRETEESLFRWRWTKTNTEFEFEPISELEKPSFRKNSVSDA